MPNQPPTEGHRYSKQRAKVMPPVVTIATVRRTKGLTLQDVCDYINREYNFSKPVERGTISAIENGHRRASATMLNGIAGALNITADEILTDYEPRASRGVE